MIRKNAASRRKCKQSENRGKILQLAAGKTAGISHFHKIQYMYSTRTNTYTGIQTVPHLRPLK